MSCFARSTGSRLCTGRFGTEGEAGRVREVCGLATWFRIDHSCAYLRVATEALSGVQQGPCRQYLLCTASPGSGKLAIMRKELAKHRVAMAVQPGAPIFELSVPCEVFGVSRPEIHDPWYGFQVCPTTPAAKLASGFVADQPGTMRDLAHADTLIVIGSENIHIDPPVQLMDALREADRRHSRIVGICSGAFVLAHAGLLDHRRATTHWMHIAGLHGQLPIRRP